MKINSKYTFKYCFSVIVILIGILISLFITGHNFIGYTVSFIGFIILMYTWFEKRISENKLIFKKLRCIATILLIAGVSYFSVIEGIIVKDSLKNSVNGNEQYIIVLGAKVNGTEPSLSLYNRLNTALGYMIDNPDTVAVVTGGKGSNEDISEAECMYNWLTAHGIDSNRIIKEDKAENTVENLRFSKNILENISDNKNIEVGIVTSEYHMHRAKLIADDLNINAVGIPAKTTMPSLALNYFIREAFALTNYYIRG